MALRIEEDLVQESYLMLVSRSSKAINSQGMEDSLSDKSNKRNLQSPRNLSNSTIRQLKSIGSSKLAQRTTFQTRMNPITKDFSKHSQTKLKHPSRLCHQKLNNNNKNKI